MNIETLNQQVITCRKCPRLVSWREAVAREKRRAPVFGAVLGCRTRERSERQAFWKTPETKRGGRWGQRVGGNDPGFGRRSPPKTGVAPAHALTP